MESVLSFPGYFDCFSMDGSAPNDKDAAGENPSPFWGHGALIRNPGTARQDFFYVISAL
jgi:hypothetical protein